VQEPLFIGCEIATYAYSFILDVTNTCIC